MDAPQLQAEILRRVWRFHRSDNSELCWLLQLAPNGLIINYNCRNEARWSFDGNDLLFLDEDGRASTKFIFNEVSDDHIFMTGQYLFAPDEPPIHALTSWRAFNPLLAPRYGFHLSSNLTGQRRLIITLNGRSRCFDGTAKHTEFEMQGLAKRVGADTVSVAERDSRVCWYGDKFELIAAHIAKFADGYESVAVVGLSAGGFGAILVAEALATHLRRTRVVSIAVNAQTSLLEQDTVPIYEMPRRFIPPVIAPDAREAVPSHVHSAAQFIASRSGSPATHTIVFDSGNPAETHFASLLANTPRCQLVGHYIRSEHAQSCDMLYRSGVVARAVADSLDRLETLPV